MLDQQFADEEEPLGRIRDHLALVANRDLYDPDHIDRVADLSVRLAARLGLAEVDIDDLAQVARLRDVGKAMVPIAVLRKQGPLDDAEWALLRRYPEHGALLVAGTAGWERLAPAVRGGNERWDGAGYPDGLVGESIPRASRITFVAQAYLAMRADRPYRPAVSAAEAVVEIAGASGSQFWPDAVTALVELLLEEPALANGLPDDTIDAPAQQFAHAAEPSSVHTAAVLPVRPPDAVRASVARGPAPLRRSALDRWGATLGALSGAAIGLALVLPLPAVAEKCPPGGEGRGICQLKDIAAPALTVVAVCAVVGMLLLAALIRLPSARRQRRGRPATSGRAAPAFGTDSTLTAANWGIVYDDDDSNLRHVGRRRWRHDEGQAPAAND